MSKSQRLTGLDGLRGLAALIVVFRHSNNAVALPMNVRLELLEGPLAIVLNAQGAVQVFFVLSGFVLAGSLSRGRGFRFMASGRAGNSDPAVSRVAIVVEQLQFFLKRFLRIYPPYVVAVLFAFTVSRFYVSVPDGHGLTRWIANSAALHPSIPELLSTFAFPGPALGLVPQGWTLRVEMIFSLLLPFMLLLACRSHWSILVLLCLSALGLADPFTDLRYAIDFAIGISIQLERDRIARWVGGIPRLLTPAIVILGLMLFAAPMFLGWFQANEYLRLWMHGVDPISIAVMGVGSGLLVISAINIPWFRGALSARPVAFLGRISFSLYLLHRVFIALFATNFAQTSAAPWLFQTGGLGLMALVLLASIPTSTLCYYAVERPSIRQANRLCGWLARRFEAEPLGTPT